MTARPISYNCNQSYATDTSVRTTSMPRTLELDRFLPYRLSVLSNTVSTAIAGAYQQRFGLTIPEWRVHGRAGHERRGSPPPKSHSGPPWTRLR